MSTNIRVDVTLQRLQNQSRQATEQNRSERQQRGQATIETVVLAGALILLISVPVSTDGQILMVFLTELVEAWAHFQRALWDALALLPGVLR